ncbi:WD40/YVTN/BNR-like repeat-containing protein [Actinoplanes sp. NPDC051859]|uniref:WD40/YVTN/BNR-like repeat-containing protein n=1 Tax=Actinoplanes sp. NPDC051859 TaxID=3363909 RepID=UPI0037B9759D
MIRQLSMAALGLATLTATSGPAAAADTAPSWQLTETGVTARFRGLAPVDAHTARVAGSGGTILRTVDGAATWQRVDPPGTTDLQFRDIEAFDAQHAVALTIGEGDQSRLYATGDGGATWTETFRNDDPAAFYDCVTFLDRRHGLALSDPVDGKFRILATTDGGRTWTPARAEPGEYRSGAAWSAARTVLAVGPTGSDISRDGGRTWTEFDPGSFDAVRCAGGACWASGEQGRVARLH